MENNRGDMDSVFGAASSGSGGEDGSGINEAKQPASQMRRPVRSNASSNLQNRPAWRGGFQYGKKLQKKENKKSF